MFGILAIPGVVIHERAEAVAIWLSRLSPEMAHKLVWVEGLLCVGIGLLGCQMWHAARWRSPPPIGSSFTDRWTAAVLHSFGLHTLMFIAVVPFALAWTGWLYIEYVAWTSPRVEAALQETRTPWGTIAGERHHHDIGGRIVSFSASAFAIGCSGWVLYWSWRARRNWRVLAGAAS